MKSIYLDIGNSSLKLASEEKGNWKILLKHPLNDLDSAISVIKQKSKERLVISSVRKDILNWILSSVGREIVTVLDASQIPKNRLNYDTPDTLGLDRYLVCYAARNLANKSVIVIDAGSACTIDFMNRSGTFEGGIIMPGLGTLKSTISEKLPELPVPPEEIPVIFPGKSTAESIQWGAYRGYAESVKQFLLKYLQEQPDAEIFITGGDARFLSHQLSKDFKIEIREFLHFEGMRDFYELTSKQV